MKQLYSGKATIVINDHQPIEGQLDIFDDHLSFDYGKKSHVLQYNIASVKIVRTEITVSALLLRRKKQAIGLIFTDGLQISFLPASANSIQVETLSRLIQNESTNARLVQTQQAEYQRKQ